MSEQKFGSTTEQKKMINKVKHDVEDWREAILLVNSLLKWDKKYYAGIVFGAASIFFLTLWLMDMAILTLVALFALFVVLMDYLYPIVSKFIFKPENWTGIQEKAYDEVCTEICCIRTKLCAAWNCFFVTKEEKSTKYYIVTLSSLIVLAYIGATIDNLFLTYLVVLGVLMYPGLQKHGFVQIVSDKVCECLSTHFKFLKQKVTDLKKSE